MYCSECWNILTVGTIYQNKRGSHIWWKFVLKGNHFCNILSFCTSLCNATLCHLPSKSDLLELALYHIYVLRGFAASGSHSLGSEELCEQMCPNVFGNEKTKKKDHVERKGGLLTWWERSSETSLAPANPPKTSKCINTSKQHLVQQR